MISMAEKMYIKQLYEDGVSKSEIQRRTTAIALKACQDRHRVRFFTAASLANILLERNNKGTLNGFFMTSLKKVELIVINSIDFSANSCYTCNKRCMK